MSYCQVVGPASDERSCTLTQAEDDLSPEQVVDAIQALCKGEDGPKLLTALEQSQLAALCGCCTSALKAAVDEVAMLELRMADQRSHGKSSVCLISLPVLKILPVPLEN
jgi:hypothetical protein